MMEDRTFCQLLCTTCSSEILKTDVTARKGVLQIWTHEETFSKEGIQFVHGMAVPA